MTPSVTFTWQPSYPYAVEPEYNVSISAFESGAEERVLRGITKKTFGLKFRSLNKTNRDAIQAFFDARNGPLSAFYWACLDAATTYTVRFVEKSLQFTRTEAALYDVDMHFVECDA